VDWRRLFQFALLGSSDVEQYAILLVRLSRLMTYFVPGVEFVGGSLLICSGPGKFSVDHSLAAKLRR
jgi:hypothetical protein